MNPGVGVERPLAAVEVDGQLLIVLHVVVERDHGDDGWGGATIAMVQGYQEGTSVRTSAAWHMWATGRTGRETGHEG